MILSTVYGILIFIFLIIFLINSIRHRKEVKIYLKYGVFFAVTAIVLDIIVVVLIPNFFEVMSLPTLLTINTVIFVRTVIFTCLGIYYCKKLGIVEIPLLRRLSGKIDNFEMITWWNYITAILLVVVGAILFSVILFKLTSPQLSETMKQLSKDQGARLGISSEPTVLTALVLIAYAFGEEILFRLGIQNYLAQQFRLSGNKYWVAVALTSAIWALAHANILTPEWVKIVQIFPSGIAFGFLFKKYGLESCIFAHGIFNLSMMGIGPYLITYTS